jgi:hypothetical protein
MNPSELTEQEEMRRGAILARFFKLKRCRDNRTVYNTPVGTKTDLGLFRTVCRIIIDGEDLNP